MHPLAEQLAHQLEGQEHWRSLMVDNHLRVKGTDCIFALGDTATIEQVRCNCHLSWILSGDGWGCKGAVTATCDVGGS